MRRRKKFDPMAWWPIWMIAACFCVIAGCPPIRPHRIEQQVHEWHMEQFDSLIMSTNGWITIGPESEETKPCKQ